MWIKESIKKTKVLKEPDFGCLRGIPSINITKGCFHKCVYCYARGFPETPKEYVLLYKNIPDLLISELETRKEKGRVPKIVTFSTASDAFQPIDQVQRITFKTTEILLKNKIKVSFLTKGRINRSFFGLFKDFKDLVQVTVGIISLDNEVHDLFEPHSAPYLIRLRQLEELNKIGVSTSVRIDPVIPGITDREEHIDAMFKRFKVLGIKDVSVSYLVLRPYILDQFEESIPLEMRKKILSFYKGQVWMREISHALTKLVKTEYRKKVYRVFKTIGEFYGIRVHVCGCKNPDISFERCNPFRVDKKILKNRRVSLFRS